MDYRVRNMNEFDDEYVDENTPPPLYNDNGFSSLTDVDFQIDIDLNVALANSDFLLQRLNSTVSRMSLDEDVCLLDIADERDLLHEQLPLDTYENLMLEIQHEYAWTNKQTNKQFFFDQYKHTFIIDKI